MRRPQRHLTLSSSVRSAGTPRRAGTKARARAGFTLVEMMVAIMILAVGLLGLASTAGYVVRTVGGATNQTVAAQVVQARMEWMRSMPCDKIKDSTATTRAVREHWRPVTTVNSVLFAIDTVSYSVGGHPRTKVFTMTVPCV